MLAPKAFAVETLGPTCRLDAVRFVLVLTIARNVGDGRELATARWGLANKIARTAWAIMVRGERYKETKLLLAA